VSGRAPAACPPAGVTAIDPDAGPWAVAIPNPEGPDLRAAISRLTSDEQALLALRFGSELTVPQIADRLQIPEGTVKSRLHATLQHLRAALDAERRSEEATR
jgi:RNA polymerase sigma-70 factor (ECF subfamily)